MSDSTQEQRNNSVPEPLRPHTFPPGVSGNPGGRPKGTISLVTLLRRKLAEGGDDGIQNAEAIIDALILQARCGDYRHIKEILERIDGKVSEKPPESTEAAGIDPAVAAAMRAAGLDAVGHDPLRDADAGDY
ncbi:MAG: DUF5681 domain-containing protein [Isosphaeraceae bacterium]